MSRAIHPDRRQIWLLPPNTDDWVAADHPARFVVALIETLDLEKLGFRQSPGDEGRPHYATEFLLAVWVYGWMERIRSSRALEKACQRDIAFLWLTGNIRLDHVTLWRFFNANREALKKLFKRVVRIAADAGLVGFVLHALDGTKLRAASSMDTALHRKQLEGLLEQLDKIVEKSVAETTVAEKQPEPEWQMPQSLATAEGLKKRIRDAIEKLGSDEPPPPPPPISEAREPASEAEPGTAEQAKENVREAIALLDRHATRHLHPNEPEARTMRTREGKRLAYNAQAVVDHDSDLSVAADISGDETDHAQLVPMVELVRETFGKVAEHTVADAGYASGGQFDEAERRHLPVLVNVQPESSTKGPYAKSSFTYDAERDVYVCPRGEALPLKVRASATSGKPRARDVYHCLNKTCPVRAQCSTSKTGRTIIRLETEEAFQRQIARQSTPAKQTLLGLRSEIVEHIFGIVKSADAFNRFTAFGLLGAGAQWALACLALNLRKLWPAWRSSRLTLSAVT